MPGLRERLRQAKAPKIAVSPIVSGQAIKGPAAKMMQELGEMISPLTVVDHLGDLLDGFVLDSQDADLSDAVILPALVTDTIMHDIHSKARLARAVVDFGLVTQSNSTISSVDPSSAR